MVEELCACDQGFGIWHQHTWKPVVIDDVWRTEDDGGISISVNWRDAYRALVTDGSREA